MSITTAIRGHPYWTIWLSVAAGVALAVLTRDDHQPYQPYQPYQRPVNYEHRRQDVQRLPLAMPSRSGVRTPVCLRPLG